MANTFSNAGLFLGTKLLGATPSNRYGHYEDREVVKFHDKLLAQAGTTWQADTGFEPVMTRDDWQWMMNYGIKRAVHPAWGFKDPRSCLFLPQWASVFPDMKVLYIYRPCVESVYSLKRRAAGGLRKNHAPEINQRFWDVEDLAVRMYLNYTNSALKFLETFSGDVCVVDLSTILQGRDIVSEVREIWDYQLHDAKVSDIFDKSIMTRKGENEFLYDSNFLPQIAETEKRMKALIKKGFTRNGQSIH